MTNIFNNFELLDFINLDEMMWETAEAGEGWTGKICGVDSADIAKIMGVAIADIAKVGGV